MEQSSFQFNGFIIRKSYIEKKKGEPSSKFDLKFVPSGVINNEQSCFRLNLLVNIEDANKVFEIEVESIGDFYFDNQIEKEKLSDYFYINAPAILFPYIRAYITSLTALSGIKPITLPTLNLMKLGDDLKKNTIYKEDCS